MINPDKRNKRVFYVMLIVLLAVAAFAALLILTAHSWLD